MEPIDPNTTRQIWQRVTAGPETRHDSKELRGLIQSAAETAALYRRLSLILTSPSREDAKKLAASQQSTVQTLRGVLRLTGNKQPSPQFPEPNIRSIFTALEHCYQRTRQATAAYAALSITPDFGPIFRQLVQKEEQHSAMIAKILGQLSA